MEQKPLAAWLLAWVDLFRVAPVQILLADKRQAINIHGIRLLLSPRLLGTTSYPLITSSSQVIENPQMCLEPRASASEPIPQFLHPWHGNSMLMHMDCCNVNGE